MTNQPESISNNEADKLIVLIEPRGRLLAFIFRRIIGNLTRRFINRAYERDFINSWSYHELHAMADRIYPH